MHISRKIDGYLKQSQFYILEISKTFKNNNFEHFFNTLALFHVSRILTSKVSGLWFILQLLPEPDEPDSTLSAWKRKLKEVEGNEWVKDMRKLNNLRAQAIALVSIADSLTR